MTCEVHVHLLCCLSRMTKPLDGVKYSATTENLLVTPPNKQDLGAPWLSRVRELEGPIWRPRDPGKGGFRGIWGGRALLYIIGACGRKQSRVIEAGLDGH